MANRFCLHASISMYTRAMDYLFDKDPINVGDRLYDIVDGIVTVKSVWSDGFIVEATGVAGRKSNIQYSYAGVQSRRRVKTLYWFNPFIVNPRKDAQLWAAQTNIIRNNVETLSDFVTSASVVSKESLEPETLSIQEGMARGFITADEQRQLLTHIKEGGGHVKEGGSADTSS